MGMDTVNDSRQRGHVMLTTTMGICSGLLGSGEADVNERLPGSRVSIQEAVSRAQIIVVTEVTDLGSAKLGPPGVARHLGVKLKPSRGLKGGTGTRELTLESLEIQKPPKEAAEAAPEKGAEYLFFIEQLGPETNTTPYRGIKVLPATKENLDAVADAQRRKVRWPGSWRNINDAARDAQLVIVAKFVELGHSDMGPPISTRYGPARIEVTRSLKGEAKRGLSPSFRVVTGPPEHAERVPVPGREYVIFIETRDGVLPHILKTMPATKANIQAAGEALQRLREGSVTSPSGHRTATTISSPSGPGPLAQATGTVEVTPTTSIVDHTTRDQSGMPERSGSSDSPSRGQARRLVGGSR
jgi:hypothetical protein